MDLDNVMKTCGTYIDHYLMFACFSEIQSSWTSDFNFGQEFVKVFLDVISMEFAISD